jgi:UDP-N-acetylglucosamine transferase subunit ALG13
MIFVTVGTTHFDGLIRAVDRLAEAGHLGMRVVCQIGAGSYEPSFCEYFRYKPNLDRELQDAGLIVTHGGFTVLEAIFRGKRAVAVVNTDLQGNDQGQFLEALAEEVPLLWTRDLSQLGALVQKALSGEPARWRPPCLADDLNAFLGRLRG